MWHSVFDFERERKKGFSVSKWDKNTYIKMYFKTNDYSKLIFISIYSSDMTKLDIKHFSQFGLFNFAGFMNDKNTEICKF